jgi:uncharacterized GH25 family protein
VPKSNRSLTRCWVIAQFLSLLLYGVTVYAAEPVSAITHLRGLVLDEAGKPLAGAPVGIQNLRATSSLPTQYPPIPLRVVTDARGRYDLALPRALGRVYVVSRVPGRIANQSTLVELDAAQLDVRPLRLARGLSLQGIVLDAQRRPIAGAGIVASAPPSNYDSIGGAKHVLQTRSGSDGRFTLQGFNAIEYALRAEASGHAHWGGRYFSVAGQKGPLEIVLREPAYVGGVLTDVAGRPLVGATVTQFTADPNLSTKTDVRGRFRLGPLPEGETHFLDVSLAGFTPFQGRVDPPAMETKLVMLRNGTLRGRVLDADTGAPIDSFSIQFAPHNRSMGGHNPTPKRSSFKTKDGRFSLQDMYAGSWAASVLVPGYARTYVPIDVEPGQPTPDVVFNLRRGGTLRGRVVDTATGKPVAGAELDFSHERLRDVYTVDREALYSELDGSFTIEGLPPGETQVGVRVEGYTGLARRVNPRRQPFETFGLTRGSTLSGQVFASDGVTPASGEVSLKHPDGYVAYNHGTDAQGRFSIHNQGQGRYLISANNGKARSDSQEIVLDGDRQLAGIRLVLEPLPGIRGSVTGLPAELGPASIGASTDRDPDRLELIMMLQTARRVQSDEKGTYRLEGLQPGPTWVIVRAASKLMAKRVVVPASGEANADFDFAAEPSITGRVTRAGRAVPNASIRAMPVDGQSVIATTTTSESGEYAIVGLAGGNYSLQLAPLEPIRVNVDRPVIRDLVLAPHDISGSLVDAATKQPLTLASIQLSDSSGKQSRLTDMSGRFSFTALEAGEYVITAHHRGYDLIQQRITLTTTVSDLDLVLNKAEAVPLRLRSKDDVDLDSVSIVTLVNDVPTAEFWLVRKADGTVDLPPALAGRTFKIMCSGRTPVTISNWNGAPLDVELRRVEGK